MLKKVKNTVPWTYVINGEEIVGTFDENKLQKSDKENFRIEKVIKRKGDKLYVKWRGCNNSFNSWIDVNVELDLSNLKCNKSRFKKCSMC